MRIDPIFSSRVILRTLEVGDVSESYIGWLNNPKINRHLEVRHMHHAREDVVHFVSSALSDPDTILLGMFLINNDMHIGNIKLGPINRFHRHGDISLFIGEDSLWGKGIASECISALTDFALGPLHMRKVLAGCYSSNLGSYKAFIKSGFKDAGRLLDHWWCEGHWEDECLLERLA